MDQNERILKLKIKEGKSLLKELLAVTKAINNNRKASELYQLFKKILEHDLGIEKYAFFRLVDNSWIRVFSNGLSEAEKNISVEKDLSEYSDLKALTEARNDKLREFDYLIPIQHKEKPLAYILLKESSDAHHISPIIRNLNFIQTLANIIVVAIENKRLFKEQLKKQSMLREMELATRIQRSLLPSPLPANERFESEAFMQAHHEIGGDYYDLIDMGNEEQLIFIADISGKGTSAALIMSNIQAYIRSISVYEKELNRILFLLNSNLKKLQLDEKYVTLFMAKYSPQSNYLEYINAGHPKQFLIKENAVIPLESSCSPAGIRDDLNVAAKKIELDIGDVLFCYTDGLIDVYNENNEWLSDDKLQAILEKVDRNQSLTELQHNVIEQGILFSKRIDRDDDIALLSLRFH